MQKSRSHPEMREQLMDLQETATSKHGVLALTADIAASFVSGNKIATADLPALVRQIHEALTAVSNGKSQPEPQHLEPAVPIKNSVKPDHIVCLEDGKKFKTLKRHLKSTYNMTPEEYRAKWGLKHDYPMVAPAYSAKRSELAKSLGLGNMRQKAKAAKTSAKTGSAGKTGGRKKAKAAKATKG
jgi:predicted transcriptional regulator